MIAIANLIILSYKISWTFKLSSSEQFGCMKFVADVIVDHSVLQTVVLMLQVLVGVLNVLVVVLNAADPRLFGDRIAFRQRHTYIAVPECRSINGCKNAFRIAFPAAFRCFFLTSCLDCKLLMNRLGTWAFFFLSSDCAYRWWLRIECYTTSPSSWSLIEP